MLQVDEFKMLEIHAKEACDQVQGQENSGQHCQRTHDGVGAVTLRAEMHLNTGLCTLLQSPDMVHNTLDVL